ncbi:MAG: hypothetical protein COB02_06065 [Candidatus Cloacimonadota bacterium]|nr:MAG: hypothetical protein COB02_12020 [Candidatus Cloacimonadota bacterium]PCJ20164.1 MAG: hypothetical protein COB02_06065 [Candidatus Cloacimonadota bacterium]
MAFFNAIEVGKDMETVIYPFDVNILLKLAKFECLSLVASILFFFLKDVKKASFKFILYGIFSWLFMIAWVQLNSTEFLMHDSFSIHPILAISRFLVIVFTVFILRFSDKSFTSKEYSLLFLILSLFSLGQTVLLHSFNAFITGAFIAPIFYFHKKKKTNLISLLHWVLITLFFFSLYSLLDLHFVLSRVLFFTHIFLGFFTLASCSMYWDRLESHKHRLFYFYYLGLFLLHLFTSTLMFLMVYRDIALCLDLLKVFQFFMIWFLLMYGFSQFISKTNMPNLSSILFLSLGYLSVFYSIPTLQSYTFIAYNSLMLVGLYSFYVSNDENYKLKENIVLNFGSLILVLSGYLVLPQNYHERLLPIFFMIVLAFIISLVILIKQKLLKLYLHPILLCSLLMLFPVKELEKISKESYSKMIDVRDSLKHLLKITNSK